MLAVPLVPPPPPPRAYLQKHDVLVALDALCQAGAHLEDACQVVVGHRQPLRLLGRQGLQGDGGGGGEGRRSTWGELGWRGRCRRRRVRSLQEDLRQQEPLIALQSAPGACLPTLAAPPRVASRGACACAAATCTPEARVDGVR